MQLTVARLLKVYIHLPPSIMPPLPKCRGTKRSCCPSVYLSVCPVLLAQIWCVLELWLLQNTSKKPTQEVDCSQRECRIEVAKTPMRPKKLTSSISRKQNEFKAGVMFRVSYARNEATQADHGKTSRAESTSNRQSSFFVEFFVLKWSVRPRVR